MTVDRSPEFLLDLVRELCKLPTETEWVEFKGNDAEPEAIGEYLSALSNSAALEGKANAYVLWGVRDGDHAIVGTTFRPRLTKVGNEELENWLLRLLAPKIRFHFFEVLVEDKTVVLLEVERAFRHPVQFKQQEFIRIGSYRKKLKDFPAKEAELWRIFDRTPFEAGIARAHVREEEVLGLLEYPSYFDLLRIPLPENRASILHALHEDRLIVPSQAGGWDITNLGAILFAKKLDDFPGLKRNAVRVIQYKGAGRMEAYKESTGRKGYAVGFEGLIAHVNGLLPANEVLGRALRKDVPMFPETAVRELVANALIHQDFFITGAGPMIEIFEGRIEISNPGAPLVDTQRLVDTAPRSRNEALASLMRRIGICEERGSGWDKIVSQTEYYQLPAPLPETPDDHTRVTLFAHRPLSKMDKEDRIRSVYLHACLRWVNRDFLTNTSLRERFGIEPQNMSQASRLIKEAAAAGKILPYDAEAAPKMMRYVPYWAGGRGGFT